MTDHITNHYKLQYKSWQITTQIMTKHTDITAMYRALWKSSGTNKIVVLYSKRRKLRCKRFWFQTTSLKRPGLPQTDFFFFTVTAFLWQKQRSTLMGLGFIFGGFKHRKKRKRVLTGNTKEHKNRTLIIIICYTTSLREPTLEECVNLHLDTCNTRLQALVYGILPLEEGSGKRCSERGLTRARLELPTRPDRQTLVHQQTAALSRPCRVKTRQLWTVPS